MSDEVQGWTNWDTGEVYNWLSNDEDAWTYLDGIAQKIKDGRSSLTYLKMKIRDIVSASYHVMDVNPAKINYQEIAEAFLEED